MIRPPHPRSYWVIPGALLAGCYPGSVDPQEEAARLRALLDAGIRHFVDLTEAGEHGHDGRQLVAYEARLMVLAAEMALDVTYSRHPIRDMSVPTVERMVAILDEFDAAIEGGRPVYVHCWGGRGRAGTAVGCCLARRRIADGERALEMIEKLRRSTSDAHLPSPETREQRAFVLRWPSGR